MHIQVKVPGSCGELIQGTLNGEPFLITCPIDRYTRVTVREGKALPQGLGAKAHAALQKVMELFQIRKYPYAMRLESELLPGKGMASSSADIAAVCFAAAASLGELLPAEKVAEIAAAIEPTDGIFFDGIVRLNQLTGHCQENFGILPQLSIAVFDLGGTVDTLHFHARRDLARLNQENEPAIKKAVALLASGQVQQLGEAATISALANQSILYKAALPQIIAAAKSVGAIGVNVAHSGTVLGILFAPDVSQEKLAGAVAHLRQAFPRLIYMKTARLIAGGCLITGKDR